MWSHFPYVMDAPFPPSVMPCLAPLPHSRASPVVSKRVWCAPLTGEPLHSADLCLEDHPQQDVDSQTGPAEIRAPSLYSGWDQHYQWDSQAWDGVSSSFLTSNLMTLWQWFPNWGWGNRQGKCIEPYESGHGNGCVHLLMNREPYLGPFWSTSWGEWNTTRTVLVWWMQVPTNSWEGSSLAHLHLHMNRPLCLESYARWRGTQDQQKGPDHKDVEFNKGWSPHQSEKDENSGLSSW